MANKNILVNYVLNILEKFKKKVLYMKKRIFIFVFIPIILFLIIFVINIFRRNVYTYHEYIVYNNTKYVIPNDEQSSLLNVFTATDEDELLGFDIIGGQYFKSKMDKDCNIIYYKGFGMCTYIKEDFSIPELDECYLEEIEVSNYLNDTEILEKKTISFSDELVIYDLATPNHSIDVKDLEYFNII